VSPVFFRYSGVSPFPVITLRLVLCPHSLLSTGIFARVLFSLSLPVKLVLCVWYLATLDPVHNFSFAPFCFIAFFCRPPPTPPRPYRLKNIYPDVPAQPVCRTFFLSFLDSVLPVQRAPLQLRSVSFHFNGEFFEEPYRGGLYSFWCSRETLSLVSTEGLPSSQFGPHAAQRHLRANRHVHPLDMFLCSLSPLDF